MRNRAKSALATAGYSTAETSAIALLVDFAAQNSGIEPRNYYDPFDLKAGRRETYFQGRRAYAEEARSIGADWRRVREALQECAVDGVTDQDVIGAAPGAFSGRLEWRPKQHHNTATGEFTGRWDYCTGQYWPTEYRKAAATVLEAASRERRRSRPKIAQMPSSIGELKALNVKNGGCWFGAGEMRFFGTRIESGILAGRYFITSEQPPHGSRTFSVRTFDNQGDIDTVGEFSKAGSKAAAMANLREHLKAA